MDHKERILEVGGLHHGVVLEKLGQSRAQIIILAKDFIDSVKCPKPFCYYLR